MSIQQQTIDDVLALEQMLEQGWWPDNTGYLRPPFRSNITITGSKYKLVHYKAKQFMVPQMYACALLKAADNENK